MLIGFSGRAGVGKTTIANMLEFHVESYATPLKMSLATLTGMSYNYFTDIELKERILTGIGKSPRQLMQLMGTEFVREMISPEFWTWRMEKTLQLYDLDHQHVAIDDIRFDNEAELVRNLGGKVIHLRRDFPSPTTQNSHKSERPVHVDASDTIIDSGGRGERTTFLEVCDRLMDYGVHI